MISEKKISISYVQKIKHNINYNHHQKMNNSNKKKVIKYKDLEK
jgi:hypothetical protein